MTVPAYPETRRTDLVEERFGLAVPDPYRWLENDVRQDAEVADWVTRQNAVTDGYLATLPARSAFADRLRRLWNYERFGLPRRAGGRYFISRNDGLQNQSTLWVQDGIDGTARLLIDPNGWAEDGATALADWQPAKDGTRLAYAVQDGGSDWRVLRVLDVESGETWPDEVRWVKFSAVAWAANGSGFFYSRFPEPGEAGEFQATNLDHAVHFHSLGTPQSADRLVYSTPDRPKLIHTAEITDDGRWLVITSAEGTDHRYEITLIDLAHPKAVRRTLIRGLEHRWELAGSVGDLLYFVTDLDAPRGRVVSIDLATEGRRMNEVVAQDAAVLQAATLIGERLVLNYLVDARSEVRLATLAGHPAGLVPMPGIGTAAGFGGEAGDPETFFAFFSFAMPTTIFRLDVATNQTTPFRVPQVPFDPAGFAVEQRFFASADGTRVPMFVVRSRAAPAGPAPLLLYGYGGFSISLTPFFSPAYLAWLEAGGTLAVANLRGGGEYGTAWHDGGRRANKQNSFDDFIAAAEHLIAAGLTTADRLAIQGGSNGGLLVGAVTNQRPDLFAAAMPQVGVMDMLRFDRFTAGRYWIDDYGDPADETDFRLLARISPYHNAAVPPLMGSAAPGRWPAILVTTADTDDRVVPGHSFKYIAAVQADGSGGRGERPHLIRIETRAGHGAGKPTDKTIAEFADLWAFAAHWTGLPVR